MAKKAPAQEVRFNPVERHLISSVIGKATPKPEEPKAVEAKEELTDKVKAPKEEAKPNKVAKTKIKKATKKKVDPEIEAQREVENLTVAKRMLLTQRESLALDSFAPRLAAAVGTPIKLSHILRSAVRLVIENQGEILEEARGVTITRPANGDMKGIEEFEMELAEVVLAGIAKGRG